MNKKVLPPIIKNEGFDFRWDNRKVWALQIPVEEIDISELDWHMEMPFWSTMDGFYDLAPSEVLLNLDNYPEHKERIEAANLDFPLDIMLNRNGRWLFLDGLHRFVKAKTQGKKKVQVRKLKPEHIQLILKERK